MRRAGWAGKRMMLALLMALLLVGAVPALAQEGALRVTDFGAACDGTTDDAPAINAAIAAGRGNVRADFVPGFRLAFPAGRTCRIDSSLNLTGMWGGLHTTIEGNGATLDCRAAGAPCLDMMGSRYIAVRDITITGHAERTPSFAVQFGRSTPDRVADLQEFTRLTTLGRFTRANLYNRAAETVRHTSLRLWGHAPYTLVLDGVNHFEVTSAFTPAAFPRNTLMSFNEPLFLQADLRNPHPQGVAIWMAQVARATFVASYAAVVAPVAVVLWTGAGTITALDAGIHIETRGVQTAFRIEGGTGRSIAGLRYADPSSFAETSVFGLGPGVETANILGLVLELGMRHGTARVFDRPEAFGVSGTVMLQNQGAWNAAPGRFQGMLCIMGRCSFHGVVAEAVP